MGILEKIAEIEREISRTQKNKGMSRDFSMVHFYVLSTAQHGHFWSCFAATEYHLGLLKAKLAKYRAQLLEPSKSAGAKGEGFDVMKSGDARVALIGFPSVGKVMVLSVCTTSFNVWYKL